MPNFDELIIQAGDLRSSDLHLSTGRPPSSRINGIIIPMTDVKMTPADIEEVAFGIMDERLRGILREKGEVDFAYSIKQVGRYRVNVFRQRGSISLVARVLNMTIPDPDELGIPESVVDMVHKRRGLVLVTGATGSGKSTTLASLVNIINHTYEHHIITLEDPIEYLHTHVRSIVNQREIGTDSLAFAPALRASLRQDPDVILVGEMRDLETISTAVTAAETGHLVFSTLHTVGAENTINRIIDIFPPNQQQQIRTQLADVLECVVSQQLLPKKDGTGRVAALEVMLTNSAVKNHIRENKTYQIKSVMQTTRELGMMTMDDAITMLYKTGKIDRETALSYSQDRNTMEKKI